MKTIEIGRKSDKDSSTTKDVRRPGSVSPVAHYLGFSGRVADAARSIPGKVQSAAAKLTRKPAPERVPTPRAVVSAPRAAVSSSVPTPAAASAGTLQIKQAIAAERKRASQILAAGIKSGQVNSACVMAFDTDLTAAEAMSALTAAQSDSADQQAAAQQRGTYRTGAADPAATGKQFDPKAAADQIVAAGEKAARGSAPAPSSNRAANRIIDAGERARGN